MLNRTQNQFMIRLLLFLFLLFSPLMAFLQIQLDNTPSPAQLVTNTLMGSGVSVSNVTFQGSNLQRGKFTQNTSNIGLFNGVVLSNGEISDISSSGSADITTAFFTPGDAALLATAKSVTTNPDAALIDETSDAAILEFDFIPTGNNVQFRFVFASEEYTDYINSAYNDVFAFYLTGQNPAGGNYTNQNMALVPGTQLPITVSTIYPPISGAPGLNQQFYLGNPIGHAFNGFTTPISVQFPVVCGQVYHFKFAIADCSDSSFDSAIFLEGGSFTSEPLQVSYEQPNGTGNQTLYESCGSGKVVISRPAGATGLIDTVKVQQLGSALPGFDYDTLASNQIFAVGEDSLILMINPVVDGITEGQETIQLVIQLASLCGSIYSDTILIHLMDPPNLQINETDTLLRCKQDSIALFAIPNGGMPPMTISWSTGATGNSITVPADSNGVFNYIVTSTEFCGSSKIDSVTLVINQTLKVDTTYSEPATCEPVGVVYGFGSGFTGVPLYHWNGPGQSNPAGIDATVWTERSPGWYYFTITDDVCTVMDSVLVGMKQPPQAQAQFQPQVGCAPFTTTFFNNSQNASFYKWNFGNGQLLETSSTTPIEQTYTQDALVQLIAIEGECTDTTTVAIVLAHCGCMDINALNFDPQAVLPLNNLCKYPDPTVTEHNVFTPNGDGDNDFFFLSPKNTKSVELIVINRWGDVVFQNKGVNPAWNGRNENGEFVAEGVYFYRYTLIGKEDQVLEGEGFLHLMR